MKDGFDMILALCACFFFSTLSATTERYSLYEFAYQSKQAVTGLVVGCLNLYEKIPHIFTDPDFLRTTSERVKHERTAKNEQPHVSWLVQLQRMRAYLTLPLLGIYKKSSKHSSPSHVESDCETLFFKFLHPDKVAKRQLEEHEKEIDTKEEVYKREHEALTLQMAVEAWSQKRMLQRVKQRAELFRKKIQDQTKIIVDDLKKQIEQLQDSAQKQELDTEELKNKSKHARADLENITQNKNEQKTEQEKIKKFVEETNELVQQTSKQTEETKKILETLEPELRQVKERDKKTTKNLKEIRDIILKTQYQSIETARLLELLQECLNEPSTTQSVDDEEKRLLQERGENKSRILKQNVIPYIPIDHKF